jgi:serine O-acetyltransferase
VFALLAADLRNKAAVYGLPPTRGAMLRMLLSDGSAAQILYRLMRFCQTHYLKPLAAIVYRLNTFLTSATIGRNAEFGPGFVILHSVGIVINTNVRAGRNLVIYHGVTLGAEHERWPLLGDDVYIGAGAKIIGGVRIGSRVRVGANAVVTRDVPDGVTVVGIPARIVRGADPGAEAGGGATPGT